MTARDAQQWERKDVPEAVASNSRGRRGPAGWWLAATIAIATVVCGGTLLICPPAGSPRDEDRPPAPETRTAPPPAVAEGEPPPPATEVASSRIRQNSGRFAERQLPRPKSGDFGYSSSKLATSKPSAAAGPVSAAVLGSPATSEAGPSAPPTATAVITEALQITRQLTADFPQNPDALEVAARVQLVLGSAAEAAALWQKCLTLNPHYAYAYAGLGTVAARKGELRPAVVQFRRALELDPRAAQTRLDLAQALLDLGELDEAARVLQDQLRQHASSAEAQVMLGMIALQQDDAASARAHYAAAVGSQPRHAGARLGLANAYTRLGQTDLARETLAEFHQLRGQERQARQNTLRGYDDTAALGEELANVCMNASRIYHAAGQSSVAERLWRRAAAVQATHIESRQALAWMHQQRGQFAEAAGLLEQLAALDPANPSYPLESGRLYGLLGVACQQKGDSEGARAALTRARELDPGNAEYRRIYETLPEQP